ncbi:MAG: NTP transferase domain-containing protein [Propionibacteriaceae bacterium]|nr:NTP transferase domain-containing protein [Propionibacteriaceae bacterium]
MTGLDAIILTGGEGSRLGGADKAALIGADGQTTLERTVQACREVQAGRVVVVGPPQAAGALDVEVTQESPPGSGPAAAIAAGWALLESDGSVGGDVLVLACDMPNVAPGVKALVAAESGVDGAIAVDGGRKQWLLALLRRAALAKACTGLDWGGTGNPSVGRLLGGLDLAEIAVPAGATDDLDTPEDLASLGYIN